MNLSVARRESTTYPLTLIKGQRGPPPGYIVHFLTPRLAVLCNRPGAWFCPKTKVPEKVTCPACLKKLKSEMAHA